MPALLTKTSMPPYFFAAASVACETSALILTLQGKKSQVAPLFAIEAAVFSPALRSTSKIATAAPSAASYRAVASPMPLAPPVTMAALPVKSIFI